MTVCSVRHPKGWLPGGLLLLAISSAWAQAAPPGAVTTLKQAFDSAWLRQPEARSQAARQQAAVAHRQVANSWTPEPASLELSTKGDWLHGNQGSREFEVALALPLWLPGERARTGALADAEVRAGVSGLLAAQLRAATRVRESYWQWQRSLGEQALALARLGNVQQLALDVAKRVKAGDLARADQHQADGAVATAQAALAEAVSSLADATNQLRALTGSAPVAAPDADALTESVPDGSAEAPLLGGRHPALAELLDLAEVARRAAELAQVQTRGNPELTLATTRDRGDAAESYQQSVTVGIRIPFGADSRNRAKRATAQAELIEAEVQLGLEQERVLAEQDTARVRLESAQQQVKAANWRLQLARESRSFVQKSYQMGESDLPTRLNVELEATEAQRQAIRARLDLAAAVSSLRQALGLLPE